MLYGISDYAINFQITVGVLTIILLILIRYASPQLNIPNIIPPSSISLTVTIIKIVYMALTASQCQI